MSRISRSTSGEIALISLGVNFQQGTCASAGKRWPKIRSRIH
jgi:hypothetical protein